MKMILFFIVLFVANVIQAITGFAGTLLAMPVSMILIGVNEAKVILNIMAFLSCLWIAIKSRKDIQYKTLGTILIFMGIGMAVGVWLFQIVSLDFLLPCYGVLIMIIALKNLLIQKQRNLPKWTLLVSLLAAGVIHGMFVSGGALLVIYAAAVLKDKNQFRATVAPVWLVLNIFLMASDYLHGYMTPEVMKITGISIVPLFLAVFLGNRLHEKINQQTFLKMTYILLIISGVSIML